MDFKLYTTALKAYTADNGDLYVRGTTSSTIRDLHGDEMTLNALHTMRDTAKNNMTIWLNHNYNVPDDIFGSVADAFIEKRVDPETGLDVYDLDLAIRVVGEDENPLAMKAYRAIKRGVKLGLSIGARVEKVSKRKDSNEQDTYVIDSVRLLESSIVGIPANQRSYLQNALRSVRGGAANLPDIKDLLDETKAVEIEGNTSPENAQLVSALSGVLADAASLYVKAHAAHWNVVGPDFVEYHDLFEEIYNDVHASLDPIAENIRKLNAPAPKDLNALALLSTGTPSPADDYDPESLASAIYASNEALIVKILSAFKIATDINQQGIANFLAERQDMHQKWSWQLRSSLAEEEVDTGKGGFDAEDMGAASKAANISFGGYVSWKNVDGKDGVGEVEQVLTEGEVSVPKSSETIAAKAGDPAVLVRVYLPFGDGYKSTGDFMGFNASQLKSIPKPKAPGAKPDATEVPGLEIIKPKPDEEKKSMDDLEQKKTRVTVTVSTDSEANNEAAVAVAPSAPATAAPERVEAAAPDAEVEPVVEPEAPVADDADEKVEEPAVDAEPAVEATPAVDAAPEDLLAAAADLVGETKAGASVRERIAVVIKELKSIADSYKEDKNASVVMDLVEKLNVILDETPSESASDSEAEKSADKIEITAADETPSASISELESLAKSALDAAIAAQQEVAAIRREFTELSGDKAKVESELAKALDVVGRLMNLPSGRKEIETNGVKGATAIAAPWLSPYIQRVLDTEEK